MEKKQKSSVQTQRKW